MSSLAPVVLLIAIALPLIFWKLGDYSLVNGDEAIYHAMARNMVESGNWLRLEFDGQHRIYDTYMNAPLQYWARAGLIALFGSNLWTVRILSALFALATVIITYRLVLVRSTPLAAFLSALILLTTFQFVFLHSARTGELEPFICFFIVLAAHSFLRALESEKSFIAHHLCFVALLNLKAPVVLIPILAELAILASVPRARARFRSWFLMGAVVAPLGLLWHVIHLAGDWGSFTRIAGEMLSQAAPSQPGGLTRLLNLSYYAETVLFGSFPYVLIYPIAVAGLIGRAQDLLERDFTRVLALYAMAVFIFFALVARTSPWYIMPAYPFLAALVGLWLAKLPDTKLGGILPSVVAIAAALLIWVDPGLGALNPFSEPALWIPMECSWRTILGMGHVVGLPVTVLVIYGASKLASSRLGPRTPAILACVLVATWVGYAGLRAALPLRHLDHQSELAQLRARIDRRQATGQELHYPIPIPKAHPFLVRYYFHEEFEIGFVPRHKRFDRSGRDLGRPAMDRQLCLELSDAPLGGRELCLLRRR